MEGVDPWLPGKVLPQSAPAFLHPYNCGLEDQRIQVDRRFRSKLLTDFESDGCRRTLASSAMVVALPAGEGLLPNGSLPDVNDLFPNTGFLQTLTQVLQLDQPTQLVQLPSGDLAADVRFDRQCQESGSDPLLPAGTIRFWQTEEPLERPAKPRTVLFRQVRALFLC